MRHYPVRRCKLVFAYQRGGLANRRPRFSLLPQQRLACATTLRFLARLPFPKEEQC
jgi:hypothetical protein